jgi:8-oxo-dGTP pyrophosphatase MutT (NUDIX family)
MRIRVGWPQVTGSVDVGEQLLHTLWREAQEEVGIALDDAYPPRYLGGWHQASIRDRVINDRFSICALLAPSN